MEAELLAILGPSRHIPTTAPALPPSHPYFRPFLRRITDLTATHGPLAAANYAEEQLGYFLGIAQKIEADDEDGILLTLSRIGMDDSDIAEAMIWLFGRICDLRRVS